MSDVNQLEQPWFVIHHSIEAEQSVIGSMLIDNSIIDSVLKRVEKAAFFTRHHRIIFEHIAKTYKEYGSCDIVTLSDSLEESGSIDDIGGLAYIADIAKNTPTSANVSAYIEIVNAKYQRRQSCKVAGLLSTGEITAADASDALAEIDKRSRKQKESIFADDLTFQEDFFFTPPKGIDPVFTDCLPMGEIGILAASGGVGKSTLTIQMAIAVATGTKAVTGDSSFLTPTKEGQVLIIGGEDSNDDYKRRIHSIMNSRNYGDDIKDKLACNLRVRSLVGEDNRLIEEVKGGARPTGLVDKWADDIERANFPNLRLIIIDPLTRFLGCNENDNSIGTMFINAVSRLAIRTGAAVLLVHHSSKDNAGSSRGASAFFDGARTVFSLVTLEQRENAVRKQKEFSAEKSNTLILTNTKANHMPRWGRDQYLKRIDDGVELVGIVPSESDEEANSYWTKNRQREAIYKYVESNPCSGSEVVKQKELVFVNVKPMGDKAIRFEIKRFIEDGFFEQSGNTLKVTSKPIDF